MSKYTALSHSTYNIGYHIVFCTKYRYRLLRFSAEQSLKEALAEAASDLGITIRTMETMPEHVHLFVTASPSLPIQRIVKYLKGYTSYHLRMQYAYLRKYPSLWTRSYFVETVGHISEKTVALYIDCQNQTPFHLPVKTRENSRANHLSGNTAVL